MKRTALPGAALLLLSLIAATPASAEVLDLVANPDLMQGVELPKLLDAVLVNPPESQDKNERGRVRLTFIVNTDGTVSDIKVTGPSPYFRLNDAAVATVLSRTYIPAMRAGKPVAVRIWAIDAFNPDPAAPQGFVDLDAVNDMKYSCRYGTHHIAVDACSALMASGAGKAREVLYPRANAYAQLRQYDLAIADYDRLIGFSPDRADLYRNRAFAYESLGQYDKAVSDYGHALSRDAKADGYYFDRGFAYDRLGQHDKAIADFAAGMEHRPQCQKIEQRGIGADMTHGVIADNIAATANPTQVANPFHETKGGGPGSGLSGGASRAATAPGATSAGGGLTTVVTSGLCTPSWVTPIAELKPVQPDTADEVQKLEFNCWTRAVWNKELDTALANCSRALQLNPNFVRAYATRAWVQQRRGDNASAIKDANAALSMNPHMAAALYIRGLSRAKTGDMAGAQSDILSARATDPDIAATYARYDVGP